MKYSEEFELPTRLSWANTQHSSLPPRWSLKTMLAVPPPTLYRPEHSSPPSMPPVLGWVTSPISWQMKCQVEAKCWNKNRCIPTLRRDETLGRGLPRRLAHACKSGGGGCWGWGHQAARSWVEFEGARPGGREAEMVMGRGHQGFRVSALGKAQSRQDLARCSIWWPLESLGFLVQCSNPSPIV